LCLTGFRASLSDAPYLDLTSLQSGCAFACREFSDAESIGDETCVFVRCTPEILRENASGTMALMKTEPHAQLVEQLRKLSSSDLRIHTTRLAEQEHVVVACLIAHIAEVSRRKLHLEMGYRSLFDFCVKRLGLSEGCAALRVHVSRVCRRHPMILDALADRRISLTVAGKLAPHLTVENRERLIADCAGMTKRQAEVYLVRLAPKPIVSSGARRCSAVDANSMMGALLASGVASPTDAARPSDGPSRSTTVRKRGSAEPCRPGLVNIRFNAEQDFMDMFVRAAEVGGMGDPLRDMPRVMYRVFAGYLRFLDPVMRQARREQRAANRARREREQIAKLVGSGETGAQPVVPEVAALDSNSAPGPNPTPDEAAASDQVAAAGQVAASDQGAAESRRLERSPSSANTRPISLWIRDRLLIRADHRCEFVGSDGTRCCERSYLSIDHIVPRALGGGNEEGNLRVFCSSHNQLAAERRFGSEFMKGRVEAARCARPVGGGISPRPDEVGHRVERLTIRE
jgi:hypothetical protein